MTWRSPRARGSRGLTKSASMASSMTEHQSKSRRSILAQIRPRRPETSKLGSLQETQAGSKSGGGAAMCRTPSPTNFAVGARRIACQRGRAPPDVGDSTSLTGNAVTGIDNSPTDSLPLPMAAISCSPHGAGVADEWTPPLMNGARVDPSYSRAIVSHVSTLFTCDERRVSIVRCQALETAHLPATPIR